LEQATSTFPEVQARMPSAPQRIVVRTSDLAEAYDTMNAAFGRVGLRPDDSGRIELAMRVLSTPDLIATRWSMIGLGGGTVQGGGPDEAVFLTGVRLGGGFRAWSRREELDCLRPFLYPEAVEAATDRPEEATLAITRAAVHQRAEALTGIDGFTVRFTGSAPISDRHDGIWRDTTAYAFRSLEALHDTPDSGLARAALTDLVARMLLQTFPNTALAAEDERSGAAARSVSVRRAVAHIDDHLDQPITVVDIARAARLTPRGLQAAFRRELDTTPMAYLRDARLAAAHAELLRTDPAIASVPAVAARWGFPDPAYFARLYRRTYGTSPRRTLEA
jgi:AraC-like DNA-binding protein